MPQPASPSADGSLWETDRQSYLHPFTSIQDQQRSPGFIAEHADGVTIWDSTGKPHLDAAAGLWCVNVGYGRKEISDAIARQSERLAYYHSFNSATNEPSIALSQRLLSKAPPNMRRVFYGSSGSDANDSAIKIAWHYNICRGKPEKRKFISRDYGYHGVSVGAGSLTGVPMVHENFGLPLDFVRHVSRPDQYRDAPERVGMIGRAYAKALAQEIEDLIVREGPDTVAAFVAEPVMGTGGVHPPPDGYFEEIQKVLKQHDILMIADEVITGFGRLGSWFASDLYGIEPDLIVSAKGLTSGYLPLSAVFVGDKVWRVIEDVSKDSRVFAHGFTYSGHPVCAAAALANLDILERESLIESNRSLAILFCDRLHAAFGNSEIVGDIRAIGLMAGLEIVADRTTKEAFAPHRKVAAKITAKAREHGVLVRALPNSDVIALSPPFVATESHIDQMLEKLSLAVTEVADQLRIDAE